MSYAAAWLKWYDVIERGAAPLSQRMIELAAIDPDHRVLDIGTGIGEPALGVASKLGAAGRVLAIDRDPEMISIARERARQAGITGIDFEVADIESKPLAPASFDSILARWSLMFVTDLGAVLAALKQGLRPGGRAVIAAWADADKVPALTLARRVARAELHLAPLEFGPGTPFGMADINRSCQAFRDAGFARVRAERIAVTYRFASAESYLQNRLDLTGPLWDGMDAAAPAQRSAVFAAIEEALETYRTPADEYAIANEAICISACAA